MPYQRIKIPNKERDIEQFWANVQIQGRILDQKGDYALYSFNDRTYLIEKTKRGRVSKIDRDAWNLMKDDIPEPEPETDFEMPSDEEFEAMTEELKRMM